jgi:ectoine hydroxylase-related dioxygenase (phytanoyl-CoA dioxygenase family)
MSGRADIAVSQAPKSVVGGRSYRLSDGEKDQHARDGYVLRRRVFDKAECAAIAEACEKVVQQLLAARPTEKQTVGSYVFESKRELGCILKWEKDAPNVVQGASSFAHLHERLQECGRDPRLVDPCKDLTLADEICLFTEKLTMKRAREGGHIVLHQDYPYWAPQTPIAHRIVTALIYLDDATIENGCLEVAPSSHVEGVRSQKNETGFGSLEMDEAKFDLKRLIPVEAEAGSVVFFDAFLVHRSLNNRGNTDRRALLYSYQPAGYPHMRQINEHLAKKTD